MPKQSKSQYINVVKMVGRERRIPRRERQSEDGGSMPSSVSRALAFNVTVTTELLSVLGSNKAVEAVINLNPHQIKGLSHDFARSLLREAGIMELYLDNLTSPETAVLNTGYKKKVLGIPIRELPPLSKFHQVKVYPEPLRNDISVEQALRFSDRVDPATLLVYVSQLQEVEPKRAIFTVWEDEYKNPCIIFTYRNWHGDEYSRYLVTRRFDRSRPEKGGDVLVSLQAISEDWHFLQFC